MLYLWDINKLLTHILKKTIQTFVELTGISEKTKLAK